MRLRSEEGIFRYKPVYVETMLRYFRILRMDLVKREKFRKYLLYALGEILLVVIGILIALQANNWNEERKRSRELGLLFRNTEEFLKPIDYWTATMFPKYLKLDSLLQVLSRSQDAHLYEEHPELLEFFFSDTLTYPLKNYYWVSPGMKELIERKTDFPQSHVPLIYDLENWQVMNEDLETTNRELSESLQDFQDELIDRAPFLLDPVPANRNKSLDFVSENKWFQFRVRSLAKQSGDVLSVLDWNRASVAELHGQLRVSEFGAGALALDSLFRIIGLSPAEKLSGPQPLVPDKKGDEAPSWRLVIFNSSGNPVDVELLEGDKVVRKWPWSSGNIGHRNLYVSQTIRIAGREGDVEYYQPGEGKFLIIE